MEVKRSCPERVSVELLETSRLTVVEQPGVRFEKRRPSVPIAILERCDGSPDGWIRERFGSHGFPRKLAISALEHLVDRTSTHFEMEPLRIPCRERSL
jgi:hypothetical protein